MNVDSEPEIIFKWTNLCRLCLSSDSHIDLFSSEVISQDCLSKIRSCLNLLVYYGDPMPAKLCSRCHLKLDEWCEFRKQCIESDSYVKNRLQPYKGIKFVKEYFERCAKFESSEIVSSSSKPTTGLAQNSDEVISSLSAQEYLEEEDESEKQLKEPSNCLNSEKEFSKCVTSDFSGFAETDEKPKWNDSDEAREKAQGEVGKYGEKKDWVGNGSELLGTIVSVTGSASALWDTHQGRGVDESNYGDNNSEGFAKDVTTNKLSRDEFERQTKACPNCEVHFATEEEFELHSCCLIGSSDNFEEYNGHFEDAISFEGDYEAETYLDERSNGGSKKRITPFKCLVCRLYFHSSLELRKHYSSGSCFKKGKALKCEFCFRRFLAYNDLLQHQLVHIRIKLELTDDDLLCCGHCALQVPDERRLKNHFLLHTLKRKQPIKYTCSFCSEVFFQKYLYEEHLKIHTEMDSYSESQTELQAEAAEANSGSEGPSTTVPSDPPLQEDGKKSQGAIRCFRCGQMFASVKQLEHHEAVKHKNPTPYICRKCCLRFSARSQLLMHLRVHMSKSSSKTSPGEEANEQTNCCTQCDAKFLLESDLESHMKTHRLPTSEPSSPTGQQSGEEGNGKSDMFAKYKCSLCSRLYVRAASCIRHGQQSHKGEKVIPLRLKRSVFLGRRTSLPLGGKVKHKCPKCPKYFFSFNAFSIHTYRDHGLKMPNPSEDPSSLETEDQQDVPKVPGELVSKCPFCSKDIKPSYISLHIKKFHRGEVLDPSLIDQDVPSDSCVCRYCLKQCSTPHNRKLHESIHYPAKAQKNQCETCGQKFTEKYEFEEHFRTCKSIRCGKCNKIFFKYTNLTQHSCSGTKNDEVHKCTVCLTAFTSLDLLQIHIKNFHGKKSETSPSQPGTSKNVAKRMERELWREESNKIVCLVGEKFYCTFCDCEFSSIQESNDHRAAHPRGNWYAVQISDCLFQCTICDKFFETRKSSLLHINYHKKNLLPEQPKPFQLSLEPEVEIFTEAQKPPDMPKSKKYNCRFCGAAFRDEEDLQDHLFHTHVNQI